MSESDFLVIYKAHRTPLYQFVWRLTGSPHTAEEVVQESFLTILDGARFNSTRGSWRTYLFGIARNLAFRRMRLSQRELAEQESTSNLLDPLSEVLSSERSGLIAQAVGALPALQREALILFQWENLSLEEISVIADCEAGAVKARLHRARETLRHQLEPLLRPERKPL
ncbi:MAG: RNA polymerase sigma factor [Acidobacteria bacterium]|nr:RNA polymerase sigma factor [Acidobacteriota bacterium]